jgi:hypothetical protein
MVAPDLVVLVFRHGLGDAIRPARDEALVSLAIHGRDMLASASRWGSGYVEVA